MSNFKIQRRVKVPCTPFRRHEPRRFLIKLQKLHVPIAEIKQRKPFFGVGSNTA